MTLAVLIIGCVSNTAIGLMAGGFAALHSYYIANNLTSFEIGLMMRPRDNPYSRGKTHYDNWVEVFGPDKWQWPLPIPIKISKQPHNTEEQIILIEQSLNNL